MTATIELPNNNSEIIFILEVLKRLNIRVIKNEDTWHLDDAVAEEHAVILRQRQAEMDSPDAAFFTWEEAQVILSNRKKSKSIA